MFITKVRQSFCTIDYFNSHLKDLNSPLIQSKAQALEHNQSVARYMLSDRIKCVLTDMKNQRTIKQKVVDQFIDLFDPTKGVTLQMNSPRCSDGTNSSKLYPFNLHSAIMKFALFQMFQQNPITKIKLMQNRRSKFTYIVGTTGYGKAYSSVKVNGKG